MSLNPPARAKVETLQKRNEQLAAVGLDEVGRDMHLSVIVMSAFGAWTGLRPSPHSEIRTMNFCFQVGSSVYFNGSLSSLPRGSEGRVIKLTNAELGMVMVDFSGTKGVLKRSQVWHERSVALSITCTRGQEVDNRKGPLDTISVQGGSALEHYDVLQTLCARAAFECKGEGSGGRQCHQNPICDPCAQGKGRPDL